jgi:trk system potassium uptake protein TrkA
MKQLNARRIIGRAVSETQEMVLNAMGIEEIIHPEQDSAEKLAKNLTTEGLIDTFELSPDYSIVKVKVPERYDGRNLSESNIRTEFDITVLAIISKEIEKSILGIKIRTHEIQNIARADSLLKKGDIMVIFGKIKDIDKFLGKNN